MLRASTAAAISHQAVHVHRTFRPETYPVFACNVGGRFCSTEEFPGAIRREKILMAGVQFDKVTVPQTDQQKILDYLQVSL
jgi:hypothetical protein